MRIAFSIIAVGSLAGLTSSPASAEAGVRPTWTDFQPAVSTQYRPPDGGRAYPKPDTRALISAADRRASERQSADADRRAGSPLPGRGGRAAPIPPASGTTPDPLATPSPAPSPIPSARNPVPSTR